MFLLFVKGFVSLFRLWRALSPAAWECDAVGEIASAGVEAADEVEDGGRGVIEQGL